MGRPGFGERDPAFAALLASSTPAPADGETVWGTTRLAVTSYPGASDPPEHLITSVRAIVEVDGSIVVCTNTTGASHPWPGGRREPGETLVQTVVREVHEETGWHLDPTSLRPLGWVHFRYVEPVDPAWRHLPHPDMIHLVLAATASDREGGREGDWTDTQGFEVSSRLVPYGEALRVADAFARPFVELLRLA